MPHRKKHHGVRLRSLFLWHRYFGFTAAVFVAVLALTGLLLNHTDRLHLAERHVQWNALLDWYGIAAPTPFSYAAAEGHVTQLGERLYLNDQPLPQTERALRGVTATYGFLIIASDQALLAYTPQGELVDRVDASVGLPTPIVALGATPQGDIVVLTDEDSYVGDETLYNWEKTPLTAVNWAQPSPAPESLIADLLSNYRGAGLSVERVLLDLHSGRILGPWGIWLMDAAAVLLLLLAITGVWHWAQRKRR